MPSALILGGYGLIGSACCRALASAGFQITGLGRSERAAHSSGLNQDWIIRDLCKITVDEWRDILKNFDVVVNAAGALQDGPDDNLDEIHAALPRHLCAALSDRTRLIQISAAGVALDASTEFFRSKARGDEHISQSGHDWVILRPTLVLAPDAYGGTGLLRGAAALPGILPRIFRKSMIQTVHIDDLASSVVAAAEGEIATGAILDVTSGDAHSLPDLTRAIRRWQGFPAARIEIPVPGPILRLTGRLADLSGRLGWRSPMRSTALMALKDGVRGDAKPARAAGLPEPRSLAATLASLPSTRQERLYARLYFALPLAIVALSIFWIFSGLVALATPAQAAEVLMTSALPRAAVWAVVLAGAAADILLGVAILWRRWCRIAALGMIALSSTYLLGGALFTPELWADPLGPMIKVVPGMLLALIVWLGVEDR